jgi:hypothetical protein
MSVNQLPAEVLLDMFKLLHPVQKRECLLVCRRWQAVMESDCLWDTIIVTGRNAMENIQGSHTQRLFIETPITHQLNSVPLMFPRLRLLYFFQKDKSYSEYENIDAANFKCWQTHLESIIGYSVLYRMLNTGIYHRLTNIALKNGPGFNDVQYTNDDVFECFQYTPALCTLLLEEFGLNDYDYESLHEYAPSLTSLTLKRGSSRMLLDGGVILPALRMTHLQIDDMNLSQDTYYRFTDYIVKKYVNLQHFSFNVQREHVQNPEEYFSECVEPLIQRLGNQVTTLGILDGIVLPCVFPLLDEANYRLQNAQFSVDHVPSFVESLVFSNQIHHLVSLTLYCDYSFEMASLKPLVHLKSLKLGSTDPLSRMRHPRNAMSLDHLVYEFCPDNLKNLEIDCMILFADPTHLPGTPSCLQTLKLDMVEINDDISSSLSVCCPQLKEISIVDSASQEITLDLPHLDISLFEASSPGNKKTYLMAEMDEQVYVYDGRNNTTHIRESIKELYGNQDISVYPHFKLGLSNSTENRTIINLTCRSLSTLYIDGRVVLLEN